MDVIASLTPEAVTAAHEKIKPYIHETSLLSSSFISRIASQATPRDTLFPDTSHHAPATTSPSPTPKFRLFFKCENFQRTGAFKARGAFHAAIKLIESHGLEDIRRRGVTTVSSGNHAQGLALAASTFDIPATIVMPESSAEAKIRGVAGILGLDEELQASSGRGEGKDETRSPLEGPKGRILFCGASNEDKKAAASRVVAETGAVLVPPYEHPDIILGQGTVALELQKQYTPRAGRPAPDAVIAPLGGGGLLGGIATWLSGTPTRIIGAEPHLDGANDASRALREGGGKAAGTRRQRISQVASRTIADGLRTPVGALNWRIVADPERVWDVFSVDEEEIKAAMRLLLEKLKIVVEPSACVPLAVVLFNEEFRGSVAEEQAREGTDSWDVVIVLSGGNTTVSALASLF